MTTDPLLGTCPPCRTEIHQGCWRVTSFAGRTLECTCPCRTDRRFGRRHEEHLS